MTKEARRYNETKRAFSINNTGETGQLHVKEKAKEVRAVLAAAKVQYEKFGVVLEKAKKKIDEAGKSLEDAQSRNNIIQKRLKSVEAIEQSEAVEILGLEE